MATAKSKPAVPPTGLSLPQKFEMMAWDQAKVDLWEERAAFEQYMNGTTRQAGELLAFEEVRLADA